MFTNFDAVIFDLDGVITDTASIHCVAWKQTFDGVLKHHSNLYDKDYIPFDIENDYLKFVDGKPRYDGVQDFLESRNLIFPYGVTTDDSEMLTVCGIGNRKNETFNKILQEQGAQVFESTIELVNSLIENEIKVGVASSSRNCMPILKKAGIDHLFEVFIDGVVSADRKLSGKPAPDIFITAANDMQVSCDRAVVIEDATSGVAAGKAGNFGLTVGIARYNNHKELKSNGADIVVSDLQELNIESINSWFEAGIIEDSWCLKYSDLILENEKSRESLMTVGNGFFASRGAFCEEKSSEFHYAATYMAGVYNKLESIVQGKPVFNEDLVNCPNWLFTSFKIDDGEWSNSKTCKVLDIERNLDLKKGILSGWALVEDEQGRKTMVESVRLISMANKNLAAVEYSITPLNYSAKISIKTSLDADFVNSGVDRYKDLNQQHLNKATVGNDGNIIWLKTSTTESNISLDIASQIETNIDMPEFSIEEKDSEITAIFSNQTYQNKEFVIYKTVAYTNSLDANKIDAIQLIKNEGNFNKIVGDSILAWENIWKKSDIEISGDRLAQKLTRLHLYHLHISASEHNKNIDASIAARGLHGEAYRGHIFWDELFIFPLYNIHYPEVTEAMLMYRYNRLEAAKNNADENGYEGAMFPWQSGRTGSEETQEVHLNPKSGKWGADYSRNQRHVSLAIGYNIIRYFQATNNKEFIKNYGFEMLLEICKFFVSACKYSAADFKYHTENMMGPDEFHEKLPESGKKGGLTDNAYTNIMLSWLLRNTMNIYYKQLQNESEPKIIDDKELAKWKEISENLCINFNEDGIIEQFKGYFNLEELDWVGYKRKYGNINRMDRILKAEGKSPDDYKLAKQADTLMIFYNLTDKELNETFASLGYNPKNNYKTKNFYYYYQRTSHGSSLSKIVHAYLANKWEIYDIANKLFKEAIISDYSDVQGGTTAEGIHTGVMAATVMHILNSHAGIDFRDKVLSVKPKLPKHWHSLSFNFTFRDIDYQLMINQDSFNINTSNDVGMRLLNTTCIIEKDEWWNIDL